MIPRSRCTGLVPDANNRARGWWSAPSHDTAPGWHNELVRRRASCWILAAAIALGIALSAPAQAQVPPLPLPPVPPEAEPALELVAPLVSPQCGNATLVLALLPSLVGSAGIGALPLDPGPLFSPVFVLCASVPVPEGSTQLVCALDDQVLGVASTITLQVIGSAPPVATRVVGPLVEIAGLIEATLPAPANAAGGAAALRTALACRPVSAPPPPSRPSAAAPAPAPPVRSDDPPSANDDTGSPNFGFGFGNDFPSTPTPAPPAVPPAAASPDQILPVSSRLVGFAYPAALFLPLLLLAVGGYLGRSLTVEVRLPEH